MAVQLHGSHLETYQAIFKHPAPHNLSWRDVKTMLAAIADVIEEPNGNLKVMRSGHTVVLHPHHNKEIAEMSELKQLRDFLEKTSDEASQEKSATPAGRHLLVVIDHREARIFETELHGALPHSIKPFDPNGFGRNLHYVQDDSNGQRKPEPKQFYEAVVKTLRDAEKILIFGTGTGASSAMNQLLADIKLHHKDLAGRIIGTVAVDEKHLTDDQLLAKAREMYEQSPVG